MVSAGEWERRSTDLTANCFDHHFQTLQLRCWHILLVWLSPTSNLHQLEECPTVAIGVRKRDRTEATQDANCQPHWLRKQEEEKRDTVYEISTRSA